MLGNMIMKTCDDNNNLHKFWLRTLLKLVLNLHMIRLRDIEVVDMIGAADPSSRDKAWNT